METDPSLSALINKYQVVYEEPQGLPPSRTHGDHILTHNDAKLCV